MSKKKTETVYTIDELAEAAGVFDTNADIIRAALKRAGKDSATENEARKIINTFKKKGV